MPAANNKPHPCDIIRLEHTRIVLGAPLTVEEYVEMGLRIILRVQTYMSPRWRSWAEGWISGADRSFDEAYNATYYASRTGTQQTIGYVASELAYSSDSISVLMRQYSSMRNLSNSMFRELTFPRYNV